MTKSPMFLGLGRREATDRRDSLYPIEPLVPARIEVRNHRYWWPMGWWGDQGRFPHCVGYAWVHYLEDGPVTHLRKIGRTKENRPVPLWHPADIYQQAQKIDEWSGENYDGTSVRAGAKILQTRGLISEYRWAWDVDTLIDTVLYLGPVVVGTWWYNNMFYPNKEAFISVGGARAGGHAYMVNGVNKTRQIFRLKNSWGRNWGRRGHAYITFKDMARLISEDGEVCIATEQRLETR